MPKLVAAAEIRVWGVGCETSSFIAMRCEPMGGGAWLEISAHGSYREPESMRGTRTENMMFDESELQGFVAVLADPDFAAREPPDFEGGLSSNGSIRLTLPLDTGVLEVMIDDGEPRRLVAVADLVLSLAERAGITLDKGFHPLNSR